jgi:hypothetical protein
MNFQCKELSHNRATANANCFPDRHACTQVQCAFLRGWKGGASAPPIAIDNEAAEGVLSSMVRKTPKTSKVRKKSRTCHPETQRGTCIKRLGSHAHSRRPPHETTLLCFSTPKTQMRGENFRRAFREFTSYWCYRPVLPCAAAAALGG